MGFCSGACQSTKGNGEQTKTNQKLFNKLIYLVLWKLQVLKKY
jgi:hypothetical protein